MTNFWDPAQMPRETEIGTAAVQAAHAAGVKHLIWSALPDAETLTGGRVKVAHFTGKARVDAAVKAAGFARHTFVMAPMYFQNFLTMMAPQPLPNGSRLATSYPTAATWACAAASTPSTTLSAR